MSRPLAGRVALVAGATRGAGRGIAVELGGAGATVWVTGRSTRAGRSEMGRAETIEETAGLVEAAGGRAVAVRCDHTDPADVAALRGRLEREAGGRLDVLVNDVWGGDRLVRWDAPFWEHDLADGLRALRNGVESHLITSHALAPLMAARGAGLIVEVTDGVRDDYRGSLFYDLVKASVIRLAVAQAAELGPHGVTAVAVTPGFLRSEAMLDHFGVTEERWREGVARDPHFAISETPRYVGRAVAALAADPRVARWAGRALSPWGLAAEYGLRDLDGSRPDWGRWFDEVVAVGADPRDADPAAYR
ncbi:SDR family oxidoreductase [Miltoncostaea marina]|uniref:SDR family oxidoreductase n=1 Tax=Miltoncostaea marina TaxID=2843215 RepID=UPI001C3D7F4C|nr:SDR family oxidoreductase [Miltoncostaea marina]